MDEFSRIAYWNEQRQSKALKQRRGVVVDIGDDAAVVKIQHPTGLNTAQYELLYTVDTLVEQIHFSEQTMDQYSIGYKALASNISDIAAMGGIPQHALIAVSMPKHYTADMLGRIYDGIYDCANEFEVAVVGGDTTSSPQHLVISITLIGIVEAGQALKRSGALPDDIVFMTGVAGKSAAGLAYLQAEHPISIDERLAAPLVAAHQRPKAQPNMGRLLVTNGNCHALNDVSDGLASELIEIAEASGVEIVIDEDKLPMAESMSQLGAFMKIQPLDWILYGGEDYILVGTMPRTAWDVLKRQCEEAKIPLYEIGYTQAGNGDVYLHRWNERLNKQQRDKLHKKGYNHFRV